MIWILIAGACVPLLVMFGDKVIKIENMLITVPGMLQDGIRIPKELFNGFILIFIIYYGISYCRLKPFRNFTIPLCLLWCLFISLISRYEFSFSFVFYAFLGFTAIAILSSLEDNLNINLFLKTLGVVGLLQCFYATAQALCLDQFLTVRSTSFSYSIGDGAFTHRMVGFVGNPSLLSMYLAMLLPIYLYIKKRWAYLTFILALLLIFACDSTTGYISALAGILFYLFFTDKKLFAGLFLFLTISSIFLGFVYYPTHKNEFANLFDGTGRLNTWKKAYTEWIDKKITTLDGKILRPEKYTLGPITGHGLRSWEYEIGNMDNDPQKQWHEAHNDWIQILYETGIVGFGLYLIFIFYLFKTFFMDLTNEKLVMMSGLVSFGVSGLTLFPLYSSCVVLYAVMFTGLILKKRGEGVCLKKLLW